MQNKVSIRSGKRRLLYELFIFVSANTVMVCVARGRRQYSCFFVAYLKDETNDTLDGQS